MRILVVGSGGREHALVWKIGQSPLCREIVVAPGNPGIAAEPKVRCIPVASDATAELVAAAVAERVDLVVCGPEVPLCAGLGDAMRAANLPFFGPSRAAAEIEGSKAFAKRLMRQADVPTAAFGTFTDAYAAALASDQAEIVVGFGGTTEYSGLQRNLEAVGAKYGFRVRLQDLSLLSPPLEATTRELGDVDIVLGTTAQIAAASRPLLDVRPFIDEAQLVADYGSYLVSL